MIESPTRSGPWLTLAIAGAAALCLAANTAPVSQAFGNTIVSTYPDGRTAELWLAQGGSYTAEGRKHDPSSGHWRVNGAKLCLSQIHPVPSPFSYCVAMPQSGLSAGWDGKAFSGEAIRIHLAQGHVTGGG